MKVMLDPGVYIPKYAHADDAGMDIFSPVDVCIPAHSSVAIDSGVHVQLSPGTVGMLKSKSGLNVKYGITSEGVIDCGYTGSICVKMYNHSGVDYSVHAGDKITQLVVLPYIHEELMLVPELETSERGDNGFGSTGR